MIPRRKTACNIGVIFIWYYGNCCLLPNRNYLFKVNIADSGFYKLWELVTGCLSWVLRLFMLAILMFLFLSHSHIKLQSYNDDSTESN